MKKLTLATAIVALATTVSANEYQPLMQSYFEAEISPWINNPVLVSAILAQNSRTHQYRQDQIDTLDQTWRAEVGTESSEIITSVLDNPASDFLRERLEQAGGVISEIFAMDARGLNVAASNVTSDYWQGDEAKFQNTYPMGAGSVHIGEVEFDESSQTYQAQISVVIVDPTDNSPIGAMTIGLNAEALF